MRSTASKLRLAAAASVLALLAVGIVSIATLQRGFDIAGAAPELRTVQGLLVLFLLLSLVLAWFAYASLQDDLSRRTAAEEALRASEAKFAGILEIAADAIISIDEHQRIRHYNRGAERIFGWTAEEMRGQPLARLIPGRFRGTHERHIQGFGAAPETARQMADRRAIYGLRHDGTEFAAEASISKLVTASGERLYTVSLRDVDARRQREEAEHRLAAAVATLGESLDVEATERAIVQLGLPWLADGAVLSVFTGAPQLRRVAAVTGDASLDAALGRAAEHPLDLDSPSQVVDVLRRGRTELVATVDDEWIEAHTSDRAEFDRLNALGMRTALLLPLVARDHVLGVLKLFRTTDRPYSETERAIAEELVLRAAFALDNARLYGTAQAATHARDHALGVVSHDLRNPISAIGMCARALRAAIPESDTERRTLAETIVDSTELTQRMIRDLLDVANIEVGRLAVERHEVHVRPILERAHGMFLREAEDRGIVLVLAPVPDLPAITGDDERLLQVLGNLLGNAMRHTDRGGSVTLGVRHDGDAVEFAVRDTGSGIPPQAMPLIFERYWTVKGNAPKGGTGLGLAIARGIVEAHGGRLWAESDMGKGSVFRFTIPCAS